MLETSLMAMLLCSVILSTISLALSAFAIAKVVGFERSTHRIEFRPADSAFSAMTDEQKKALLKNDWMDDLLQ
jgi:hypothetical protein